jgi:hypothetical protein
VRGIGGLREGKGRGGLAASRFFMFVLLGSDSSADANSTRGEGRRYVFGFDFPGDVIEGLDDVDLGFGRGLEKGHFVGVSEGLASGGVDFAVRSVALVADEDFYDPRIGMCIDLLDPAGHTGERVRVGTIIGQYDTHRSLVVGLSDRTESFLTRRIPHLQFDRLPVQRDRLYLEVNPYPVHLSSYRSS